MKAQNQKEFISEFTGFKNELTKKSKTYNEESIVTLFAIFRKDQRTAAMYPDDDRKPGMITKKQEALLIQLVEGGQVETSSSWTVRTDEAGKEIPDLTGLTLMEASTLIEKGLRARDAETAEAMGNY